MDSIELNDDILLNVAKPARYIGEEFNMARKDWPRARAKICLCYPDTYEVGMSHLGLKILYHILNEREGLLCERAFAPWHDMEKLMLEREIPLFSLESRRPLASFDIVGFSLQHEMTYTNLINMLRLSAIPLRSRERREGNFPLVIAGGPCAFNPEPLAEFIDLFIIGDAEEAVIELVDVYLRVKEGRALSSEEAMDSFLREAARVEGVYVPSLYEASYADGRIEKIAPKYPGIPGKVKKRTLKTLANDMFPTRPLVPYISTVHDRVTLEIMRGCAYNCNFCQARNIYAPLRYRKPDELIELAASTYKNTGFDEVSLLSLSSASYPHIERLITGLMKTLAPLGVGISLPSLRLEEDLGKLPSLIGVIKKSGLTFAPEVGTERMSGVINKKINREEFFKALKAAYRMGWRRVKLYFMIGLPTEEEDDLEGIVKLADEAAMLKKEFSKSPADVIINVSSFIPKPHTPFQWVDMAPSSELEEKQRFLMEKVRRKRYLRLKLHNIASSIIEAVLSRGDRRLADAVFYAWKEGARFDAWTESFRPEIWERAFERAGIDTGAYLNGADHGKALPWGHIECAVKKESLLKQSRACIN